MSQRWEKGEERGEGREERGNLGGEKRKNENGKKFFW